MKPFSELLLIVGGGLVPWCLSGCSGGGGVCTRSCDAIEAERQTLSFDGEAETGDLFGPEIGSIQCRAGQLALEALDCGCEEAQGFGTREDFVSAVEAVCGSIDDGILLPGFSGAGSGQTLPDDNSAADEPDDNGASGRGQDGSIQSSSICDQFQVPDSLVEEIQLQANADKSSGVPYAEARTNATSGCQDRFQGDLGRQVECAACAGQIVVRTYFSP